MTIEAWIIIAVICGLFLLALLSMGRKDDESSADKAKRGGSSQAGKQRVFQVHHVNTSRTNPRLLYFQAGVYFTPIHLMKRGWIKADNLPLDWWEQGIVNRRFTILEDVNQNLTVEWLDEPTGAALEAFNARASASALEAQERAEEQARSDLHARSAERCERCPSGRFEHTYQAVWPFEFEPILRRNPASLPDTGGPIAVCNYCLDFLEGRADWDPATSALPRQGVNYRLYLASREWGLKRRAVRERSGGVCERCHVNPHEETNHLTYERLGYEDLRDLQGLCRGCHRFVSGVSDVDPAAHTSPRPANAAIEPDDLPFE